MLSDAGSYAFGLLELCFRTARAMLLDARSNAFGPLEQCFRPYGAVLWTLRSMPLYTYRAML